MIGLGVLISAAACTGEDRPGSVSIDPESETVSVSGTGTGTKAGPGVVKPPPKDATIVTVDLVEWAIVPDRSTVPAGKTYFLTHNRGPEDPHELVIVRTDIAPGELPTFEGRVPEDQVDLIGEVEAFEPGTSASGLFDLAPGKYALICNLVEMEDGEMKSHYELGMYTSFTVE